MVEVRVKDLRGNLRKSWIDGASYMLMVGLGEHYLPAFVLAIGLGDVFSGWVATVPMLAGALIQLATPHLAEKVGSLRRWVVWTAALQAAVFVPLAWVALRGGAPAWVVFLLATAYWATGLATGPAWITWISTLVPKLVRARYFARRNRGLWVTFAVGFVAAGGLLEWSRAHGRELQAFALLFALAGLARCVSAYYLSQQDEPEPLPRGWRIVPNLELLRRWSSDHSGRLIACIFVVQIAVQTATPFLTAFMRTELQFSYTLYALLYATPYVARIVALDALGDLAHKQGVARTIWLGGLLFVPSLIAWMATDSVLLLILAQILAGVAFAAWELGTFLAFFDHVPEAERTSVYALYNVGLSTSMAVGSLAGGALLGLLGSDHTAYLWLFALSTLLRVAAVPLVARVRDGSRAPATES
ncbi:MAG: MFS transporter [Planctomycetes bacterium]|nr:MFS transporter [Planctomycetota bacterium]